MKRIFAILITASTLIALPATDALASSAGSGGGTIADGNGSVRGQLVVGLTVSSDGSPGQPASSPNAPSPYRIIATPGKGDPSFSPAGTCNASSGGQLVVFGWYWNVTVYDNTTGVVVSQNTVCVAFPRPGTTPAPPGPQVPPTIGQIWQSVNIPNPTLGISPLNEGVTGLDTWMWATSPSTITVNATINGWTITGTATRTQYLINPGEGTTTASRNGGSLQQPAVSHLYETKGPKTIALASQWSATVTMTGPGLPARVTNIGNATLTTTTNYRVSEIRGTLTG